MLETNDLLVKCPKCGAWPMAVGSQRNIIAHREVSFRCPRCGSEEEGRLRHAAALQINARGGLDPA